MKQAWLRFYAELNDFLAPERRGTASAFNFFTETSVKDAIESCGVPHTEVELILVNGEAVDFHHRLAENDQVSIYPVFEAFDITPILRVRPEPLRITRFIADVHLGRLAVYLRMAGFDTAYSNHARDEELAQGSAVEHRILLTCDRGLLKRTLVSHGYCVRAAAPREQLLEVLQRFDLQRCLQPLTRCLECNRPLVPAPPGEAATRVPARVLERHQEFRRCPDCGRLYWKGSHFRRMEEFLARVNLQA